MSNFYATAAGVTKTQDITAETVAEMTAQVDAIRAAGQLLAADVAAGDETAISRFIVLATMIARMEAEIAEIKNLQEDVAAYSTIKRVKL